MKKTILILTVAITALVSSCKKTDGPSPQPSNPIIENPVQEPEYTKDDTMYISIGNSSAVYADIYVNNVLIEDSVQYGIGLITNKNDSIYIKLKNTVFNMGSNTRIQCSGSEIDRTFLPMLFPKMNSTIFFNKQDTIDTQFGEVRYKNI